MAFSNRQEKLSSVTHVANANQATSHQVWRYSNINNVKVVYNSNDAKNYLLAVAKGWGIDESSDIGRNFLNNILKATQQHHPVPTHPSIFEYPMETEHETHYMLILIYAKEDRIEIGYSYHYMTNQASAKCNDPMISQRYSIQWLREKARQSLKLPTAIVTTMMSNDIPAVHDSMHHGHQQQLPPASIPVALFANALHNDIAMDDISQPISSNNPAPLVKPNNLQTKMPRHLRYLFFLFGTHNMASGGNITIRRSGVESVERHRREAGSAWKHTHVNGSRTLSTVNDAQTYIDTLAPAWDLTSSVTGRIFIADIKAQCTVVGSGAIDHVHVEFNEGTQTGTGKYILVAIHVDSSRRITLSYTYHEVSDRLRPNWVYTEYATGAVTDWLKSKAVENLQGMVPLSHRPSITYE
ncbi:unnamed protein product [Rotaria sp. Silwood2]|nr:unnamed protein product [Rotaria sp. Silwood2]CAF4595293.1 unnamed protein product [Rotaria sp. Silwood2]